MWPDLYSYVALVHVAVITITWYYTPVTVLTCICCLYHILTIPWLYNLCYIRVKYPLPIIFMTLLLTVFISKKSYMIIKKKKRRNCHNRKVIFFVEIYFSQIDLLPGIASILDITISSSTNLVSLRVSC